MAQALFCTHLWLFVNWNWALALLAIVYSQIAGSILGLGMAIGGSLVFYSGFLTRIRLFSW